MEQVRRELSPVRLEAFSDGVIAIIITIMVLELRLPAYAAEQGLLHGLFLPMAPKFATYAMSFLLVAIMWVNHNAVIGTVHDCTRAIFWQNNYLLFWMSLIPLSTAFLGDHPRLPDAYAVYGFVLAAACSGFAGLRWLASRQGRGARAGAPHGDAKEHPGNQPLRGLGPARLRLDLRGHRHLHRGPGDVLPADLCASRHNSGGLKRHRASIPSRAKPAAQTPDCHLPRRSRAIRPCDRTRPRVCPARS